MPILDDYYSDPELAEELVLSHVSPKAGATSARVRQSHVFQAGRITAKRRSGRGCSSVRGRDCGVALHDPDPRADPAGNRQ